MWPSEVCLEFPRNREPNCRLGQQMIEEAIRSGGNVKRLNNVGLPELIPIGDGIFGGREEDLSMASLSRTLIGLLRRSLP